MFKMHMQYRAQNFFIRNHSWMKWSTRSFEISMIRALERNPRTGVDIECGPSVLSIIVEKSVQKLLLGAGISWELRAWKELSPIVLPPSFTANDVKQVI